jgi:hypothetical protein
LIFGVDTRCTSEHLVRPVKLSQGLSFVEKRPVAMNRRELEIEACRFRLGLEDYYRRNPDVNHTTNFLDPSRGKFPLDHCKAASFMFGHYLLTFCSVEKDRLYYVWGARDKNTHGWIEYDGWIVDLTADQHEDETRPVIVEKIEDSLWHQNFLGQSKYVFNLASGHKFCRVSEEIGRILRAEAK